MNRLDDPSIRGIIVNYRDVTESRRAEEALREGEARYRQLTEQATDIIYNCDLEGRFTFVNPTAVTADEVHRAGAARPALPRRSFGRTIGTRDGVLRSQQRSQSIRSTYFEFPAVAKDGSEIWLGQSVQIVEERGTPVGVQAIARDITARLALEISCGRRRRWKPSAGWPAASPTISTTC